MSRLLQFSGLLGVSTAVHVGLFLGALSEGGAPAGAGGADAVMLAAVPPHMAQMVQDWTRPVDVQADVAAMQPPPVRASAPELRPSASYQLGALPLPLQITQAEVVPDQATPPAPPPPPVPVPPKVRPRPRPTPPVAQAPVPPPKPAAKPAPSAPAQAAQRAAGAGGGASAGTSQAAGGEAPSAARLAKLKSRWGGAISARIAKNKRRPSGDWTPGEVRLSLVVATSGRLTSVRVARSSGVAALDRAALKAAQGARLPKAPKALPAGQYEFGLTLEFTR